MQQEINCERLHLPIECFAIVARIIAIADFTTASFELIKTS